MEQATGDNSVPRPDDKTKRRKSESAVMYEAQAKRLITEPQDKPARRMSWSSAIANIFKSRKKPAEAEVSADGDTPKRRNSDTAVIYEAQAKRLVTVPRDQPTRRMSGGVIGKLFKSKNKLAEAEASADCEKPKRRNSKNAVIEGKSNEKIPKIGGSEGFVNLRGERTLGKETDDDSSERVIVKLFESKKKPSEAEGKPKPKRRGSKSTLCKTIKTKNKSSDTQGKSNEKIPKRRGSGISTSLIGERKLVKENDDGLTEKSPKRKGSGNTVSLRGERKLGKETDDGSTAKIPKSRGSRSSASMRGERKVDKETDDDSTAKTSKSSNNSVPSSSRSLSLGKSPVWPHALAARKKTKRRTAIADNKPNTGKSSPVDASDTGPVGSFDLNDFSGHDVSAAAETPKRTNSEAALICEAQVKGPRMKPKDRPTRRMSGSAIGKMFKSKKKPAEAEISANGDKPKRRKSDTAAIYEAQSKGLISEAQDKPTRRMSGSGIGKLFRSKKKRAEVEVSTDAGKPKRRDSKTAVIYKAKRRIHEPQDKPARSMFGGVIGKLFRSKKTPAEAEAEDKPKRRVSESALSKSTKTKNESCDTEGKSNQKSSKSRGSGSSVSCRGERKLGKGTDDGSTVASEKKNKESPDTDDKPKRKGYAGAVTNKGSKESRSERGTDDSSTVRAPKPERDAGMGKDGSVRSPKSKRKNNVGSSTGKDAKSKSSKDGNNTTTTKKKSSKNSDKSKSLSDSVSSKDAKKDKLKATTLSGIAITKESKSEASEHAPKAPVALSSNAPGKKKVKSRRAERKIDEESEKRTRGNSLGAVNKDKIRKKKKKKKQERRRSFGGKESSLDGLGASAMPDLMGMEAFNTDGEALGTTSLNDAPSTTQENEMFESDLSFNKLEIVRLRQSLDKAIKDSESQRQERKEFDEATTELIQLRIEHQKAVEERRRLKIDLDTGRLLLTSLSLEL
jgi:hypothetical protein